MEARGIPPGGTSPESRLRTGPVGLPTANRQLVPSQTFTTEHKRVINRNPLPEQQFFPGYDQRFPNIVRGATMPISEHAAKRGIVSSKDLTLVSSAFEGACRQSRIDAQSRDAEAIAERIVAAYERGIRKEDELIKAAVIAPPNLL